MGLGAAGALAAVSGSRSRRRSISPAPACRDSPGLCRGVTGSAKEPWPAAHGAALMAWSPRPNPARCSPQTPSIRRLVSGLGWGLSAVLAPSWPPKEQKKANGRTVMQEPHINPLT